MTTTSTTSSTSMKVKKPSRKLSTTNYDGRIAVMDGNASLSPFKQISIEELLAAQLNNKFCSELRQNLNRV